MDRLGRQLAGGDGRQWQFQVIRDDVGGSTHEPGWLPGGYVYVPAALIVSSRNEAEVAGMLAHSIAHVMEHQGIRTAGNGQSIPLIFTGGFSRNGMAVPVAFIPAQRASEMEADLRAAELMRACE